MTAKNWGAVLVIGVALYFTGVLNRATQNKPAQAPSNTQIYLPSSNQATDILTAPNPYAGSTFNYNKQQVTCTTGVNAYNEIVTTCEQ